MKRITLHIDRLALHGLQRADANAVSTALQAELQRLLVRHGAAALTASGDVPRLQAGPVRLAVAGDAAGDAAVLGRAVARQIATAARPPVRGHGGRP